MSFVLGMLVVIVIAIVVIAIMGFVKARKTEASLKELEDIMSKNIEIIYNNIHTTYEKLDKNIQESHRTLSSSTDSRFDKLYNTIERDYITKKNKLDNSIDYNN